MERIDSETGEITDVRLPMPPEIAKALLSVMKATKKLGYDETNAYGKYGYVSIDKFLSSFNPLFAEAGMVLMMDEVSVDILEGKPPEERDGKKASAWIKTVYSFTFYHESGVSFGPVKRTVMVPAVGAQAFGSAQSYLLKQFIRAVFFVATGDKDDDAEEAQPIPQRQQRAAQAGNGAERTKPQTIREAAAEDDERAIVIKLVKAVGRQIEQIDSTAELTTFVNAKGTQETVARIRVALPDEYDRLRKAVNSRRTVLQQAEANAEPAI